MDDKLIYSILRRMYGSYENACKVAISAHMEIDDLLQAARIAWWKADKRFNPDLGFKYSTYIGTSIRGAIQKELRRKGNIIHVPHMQRIEEHQKEVSSLNVTVGDEDKSQLQDVVVGGYFNEDNVLTRIMLEERLNRLKPRERLIVKRTIQEKHQIEISKEIGVSQVQVSRLLRQAVDQMKEEVV